MALMAVLRWSSRFMASVLDFWMKKRTRRSDAKIMTTISSIRVKPDFVLTLFINLLYHESDFLANCWRSFWRAWEVKILSNQPERAVWFLLVRISTMSPFFRRVFKLTIFPFIFTPVTWPPISEWRR